MVTPDSPAWAAQEPAVCRNVWKLAPLMPTAFMRAQVRWLMRLLSLADVYATPVEEDLGFAERPRRCYRDVRN